MRSLLTRLRIGWSDALLVGVAVILFTAWGQPVFSDELATSRNVFTFAQGRTLVPGHFAYGALYSYLAAPFAALGITAQAWSEGRELVTQAFVDWFATPERLVWWTRIPSLIAYLVLAQLLLRRASASRTPALGAALVVGLLLWPPCLRYGALAVPDVLVALLVVVSLQQWDAGRPGRAGLAFGLAFAAKATAATVGLAWLVAPWLVARDLRGRGKAAGRLALGGLIGFVVGAPSWLLEGRAHLAALLKENTHVRVDGHLGDWGIDGVWLIERLVPDGLVLLIAAAGVAVFARRRGIFREPWAWGAVGAVVLLWGIEKKSPHYLLPLLATVTYGLLSPPADDGAAPPVPRWGRALAWGAAFGVLLITGTRRVWRPPVDGRAAATQELRELLRSQDTVWLCPDYAPDVVDVADTPWPDRPHVDARARTGLTEAWHVVPRANVVRTPLPDLELLQQTRGRVFLVEASGWSARFLGEPAPIDHPLADEIGRHAALYRTLRDGNEGSVVLRGEFGGDGGNVIRIYELRTDGPR